MITGEDSDDRAPWARATAVLRRRIDQWIEADPARSMNGLARDLGYVSPNGLRKALAPDHGPNLAVLLRLAGALGYRSIEELFGDFTTTPWIEELRRPVRREGDAA